MASELKSGHLAHDRVTAPGQAYESHGQGADAPRLLPLQQAGNQAVAELLRHTSHQPLAVVPPTSPDEAEADRSAAAVLGSGSESFDSTQHTSLARSAPDATASDAPNPLLRSSGRPLDPHTRTFMQARMGKDFGRVRIHSGDEATASARALGARAYTVGTHIAFDSGHYNPDTPAGRRLLAHELTHVAQPPSMGPKPLIRRETAEEVVKTYSTDWILFTSVDEEGLANRMRIIINANKCSFAAEVLRATPSVDRDDVVNYMMPKLSVKDLIAIDKKPGGPELLTLMKDEVGGGYASADEFHSAELLEAVIAPGPTRDKLNRHRIEALKEGAASDLEALANMFEDDQIIDDGTVPGRLQSILEATKHLLIPGLQTGIKFKDTGFRGEPTPTGSGFRDPHPSSANQVGHFLTAVGLEFSPQVVSKPLFGFPSIREMVEAPREMSDADVALRLTIGHEKAPDPNGGLEVALQVGLVWAAESLKDGPEGETDDQRDERINKAVSDEIVQQVKDIIAAFRKQFKSCTDADVAAWNEALAAFRQDEGGLEKPGNALDRIDIDPTMKGNSRQDLRLSLVGWRLGEKIQAGDFASSKDVGAWIRKALGNPATP